MCQIYNKECLWDHFSKDLPSIVLTWYKLVWYLRMLETPSIRFTALSKNSCHHSESAVKNTTKIHTRHFSGSQTRKKRKKKKKKGKRKKHRRCIETWNTSLLRYPRFNELLSKRWQVSESNWTHFEHATSLCSRTNGFYFGNQKLKSTVNTLLRSTTVTKKRSNRDNSLLSV